MKIAYFNCSSGISGDMFVSSCLDAGINTKEFEKILKKKLAFKNWKLQVSNNKNYHFPAKTLLVRSKKFFNSPFEIKNIIAKSSFSSNLKDKAIKILNLLILAESKIHKISISKVHFHELNSPDTLIDITGACLAIELLGINDIYSSCLNIGKPAPATLEIIKHKKIPVYSNDSLNELTTPTGAAIISTVAKSFGDMPEITPKKYGFGAGEKCIQHKPNVLNLIIGYNSEINVIDNYESDQVLELQTNIDDMDPRIYPYIIDKLFTIGAKDVTLTQVLMKKGRPGIILSVLCSFHKEKDILSVIFNETTTLGIRRKICQRYILKRKYESNNKIAYINNDKTKIKSEFEKAKKTALKKFQPLKQILI